MIVNHKYRFIFLKTMKTASTSIEIALSQYCGPDDIVTRLGWRDEPKRSELGFQGPANYLIPKDQYTSQDWVRHFRYAPHRIRRSLVGREGDVRKEVSFYNHMPASAVRERLDQEVWNGYFKFCYDRNPWDRAISAYYWENRSEKTLPDFYPFLEELQRKDLISNFPIYSIDGRIAVDRVLHYEKLDSELPELAETLGLPGPLTPARAKQQFRKDRRPYSEVYTDRERDFVAAACANEIRELGYEF